MKRSMLVSALFLICGMLAVSCTSGKSITGMWQEAKGSESIEFLKDGTFNGKLTWDMNKQPVEVAGSYTKKGELIDLKLRKPANLAPMTWKASISGTEMKVTFQHGGALKIDGSSAQYRRMQ